MGNIVPQSFGKCQAPLSETAGNLPKAQATFHFFFLVCERAPVPLFSHTPARAVTPAWYNLGMPTNLSIEDLRQHLMDEHGCNWHVAHHPSHDKKFLLAYHLRQHADKPTDHHHREEPS